MAYGRDDRDRLFEEWYQLGKPSANSFFLYIGDEIIKNPQKVYLGLRKAPVQATLLQWMKRDNWEPRAAVRDEQIQKLLAGRAGQLKKIMFDQLQTAAQELMGAQLNIVKAADFENMSVEEARIRIPEAISLGENAVRMMKEALLLVSVDVESEIQKPELNQFFQIFESLFGVGGELKLAMQAKLNAPGENS
jgi:hypothetical protein